MSLLPDPARMTPLPHPGHLSLVGAGPGAADLMTYRAVRRLQQADVVLYDRLVSPEVLDLIPATIPRLDVGKDCGNHRWTQADIDARIAAELRLGRRVVRLKSGDPAIFGRAGEEIAIAMAEGATVEIVPGVTAVSAAAASLCQPLTTRGLAQRLVLATATDHRGDLAATLADDFGPGTTLALYMAMTRLDQVECALLSSGAAPDTLVTIVCACSTPQEQRAAFALKGLAKAVAQAGDLRNPAIVLLTWGLTAAQGTAHAARLPAIGCDQTKR
ncbi:uroporphyrinogen-III C-methyltransferase [Fuscibacter oryzae]|uniref:uroporphyrinogen-III C-methyltransferase n=1 Tax=Fuscibacter oryzae TaxID=2803939 RepID=A0A8J7MSS3_9RHOB|nr:uroporphyrinogen-III C-methyltransferase [Fuscibacter oryzae]MBL4929922.1 uroporphyrinogen-III C-methyltransferase [Fuscibacter oryzae]